MTVTCWTQGGAVGNTDGDNIWLYTTDNCYIPQFNVAYNGTAEEDLAFCGRDSEVKSWTTQDATTTMFADCARNMIALGAYDYLKRLSNANQIDPMEVIP
ncbi:hypothetical protein G7Y89_g7986 [Cudoniella acicularis]|uniref:Uncharacterized protein n=1 Tax=Cudoniella acicularis TaxID=354080 RepID=A0A8H4RHG7_9HELO|nr:hypothetical protein G7Y89_g7986 [Cudoniella acicularis]